MAISFRPSFSRTVLPAIAVIGLIVAAVLIWRGLPDHRLEDPAETPARATGALAQAPRGAGSGVVEPSSGGIDIGTAVSGLVTAVPVPPPGGCTVSRRPRCTWARARHSRLPAPCGGGGDRQQSAGNRYTGKTEEFVPPSGFWGLAGGGGERGGGGAGEGGRPVGGVCRGRAKGGRTGCWGS